MRWFQMLILIERQVDMDKELAVRVGLHDQ